MRKIILSVLAVFAFGAAQAQDGGFKAGVSVGLPIGDFGDFYSLSIGADVAYMWNLSEKFKAGAGLGYLHFMGKKQTISDDFFEFDLEAEDAGFIPVYGSAQYSLTDNIFLGADLGYAIGGSGTTTGGILYHPKAGFQTDKFEVFLGYRGISAVGSSINTFNLGFNYKF